MHATNLDTCYSILMINEIYGYEVMITCCGLATPSQTPTTLLVWDDAEHS